MGERPVVQAEGNPIYGKKKPREIELSRERRPDLDDHRTTEPETEQDERRPLSSLSRRRVLKATVLAGVGLSSLSSAIKNVRGQSGKPISPDPDGDFDVNISNGTLEVNVGELVSGIGVGGSNWIFQEQGTMYRETYGFQDGTGPMSNAEQDGSVVSTFPSSVSPGTTAEATVEIPLETTTAESVTLEVVRKVTLDPTEATLRVEYDVTNPDGSGVTISNLQISQYVDYDIGSAGGEVGEYFLDQQTNCEFIFQEDTGIGLFAGFTGESISANHDLAQWSQTLDRFRIGEYNNDNLWPDSGTGDVGLAFEWDLGTLAPGESTSFRNSFVYNENEADFETEICQESPANQPPTASFSYDPGDPEVEEEIAFDASGSSDPDGDETIVSYEWDFGDGTMGTGETTTHSYVDEGEYDVTLTVTDDADGISTDTQTVPVVVFANPLVVDGEEYLPTDPDEDGLYEDVNGDGAVTADDSTSLSDIIKAYRKGNLTLAGAQVDALDFNGDGELTNADKGAYNRQINR
ncbi:PKD domain-containing protein [Haloarcula sp. 1CSR25-25]|uniref:PKD domain-containing protein n=1 Tax=Haloarcula sp. 1CSR25-25 TaxID=2862545 RepID=UPI002895BE12|nr:PKD domain-containing protein [Haloarcula sp. 1CSR25-25]MDT3433537.1 PKD domain-containing protein [Haloarcula sp. 1CSR25-25]